MLNRVDSRVLPPDYRLKLTFPAFTPLAAYIDVGQASRPRPAASPWTLS